MQKRGRLLADTRYSPKDIALKSGMEEEHYLKLESGELKMKIDDAGKLLAIYKIEPEVFLLM